MSKKPTHIDQHGQPRMVDVSDKKDTVRIARASGRISLSREVMNTLHEANYDTPKGAIIQTAIIAATMAVKNTHNIIPLCHPLPVSGCKMTVSPEEDGFRISCEVKTNGKTGVEMEALHGVSVAALTIYDICKALSHEMSISDIQLDHKSGGKNDYERT